MLVNEIATTVVDQTVHSKGFVGLRKRPLERAVLKLSDNHIDENAGIISDLKKMF